jgi:hypothetical protein
MILKMNPFWSTSNAFLWLGHLPLPSNCIITSKGLKYFGTLYLLVMSNILQLFFDSLLPLFIGSDGKNFSFKEWSF